MKNIFLGMTFVIFFTMSATASAASAIDAVKSIVCEDASPTPAANVFFTTDDEAAHKYYRDSGEIPYDYGNKKPFGNAQTGVMKLINDPATYGGVYELVDLYDPELLHRLVLIPTEKPGVYRGLLGGHIEIGDDWKPIDNHEMKCVVLFQ